MMTHKPGPWEPHSVGNRYGNGEIFEIHWSADGECVAEIVHGAPDARLIAAAPELLEALESLVEKMRQVNDPGYFSTCCDVEKAIIAIAKARGE